MVSDTRSGNSSSDNDGVGSLPQPFRQLRSETNILDLKKIYNLKQTLLDFKQTILRSEIKKFCLKKTLRI